MHSSIYKLPDILLIHLKRFQMTARWREKITTKIVFPLLGLDMDKYVFKSAESLASSASASARARNGGGVEEEENKNIYDLYAVSNHFGNLSSGHYTAYVKTFNVTESAVSADSSGLPDVAQSVLDAVDNESEGNQQNHGTIQSLLQELFNNGSGDAQDGVGAPRISSKWMYFDDETVTEVPSSTVYNQGRTTSEGGVGASGGSVASNSSTLTTTVAADRIVSEHAYVLFYRRRVLTSSNIVQSVCV